MRKPRNTSQWVAHFSKLDCAKTLKRLSTNLGSPVLDLESDPAEVARKRLLDSWDSIYIPGPLEIELMLEMVQISLAHACQWYPDDESFLGTIYGQKISMRPAVPICLTGLSGVGKSALRRALVSMFMPPSPFISVAQDHGDFPWVPIRTALIQHAESPSGVLRALAEKDFPNRSLDRAALDLMYRTGTCFNLLDEMQSLTLGDTARAMVGKVLLKTLNLGIPMLYICNFSLGHRLKKMHHELRQAFLGNLRVLPPSSPTSKEWMGYLKAMGDAAPGVLGFDVGAHSVPLWNYTAGLKRNLQRLLGECYLAARKVGNAEIAWSTVENVYESPRYFASREEVEALMAHAATGKKISRDLMCPFDDDANQSDYHDALRVAQRGRFVNNVGRTALNAAEGKALESFKREADGKPKSVARVEPVAPVGPSKTKKRASKSLNSSDLIATANALLQASGRNKGS